MKKILIPTNFSDVSEAALTVAVEFARKSHSVIELLHIIEAPYEHDLSVTGEYVPADGIDDLFVIQSIEAAKKKFRSILHNPKYAGVRFEPKIKIGNSNRHIANRILQEPVEMIIMGTEGSEHFLKGIFFSTNTEKVMAKAKCLVLTVRNEPINFHIRNVVFATNFKDVSEEYIQYIKELQYLFDFKLHLLYIHPERKYMDEAALNDLKNSFATKYQIENYDFHSQGDWTEYTEVLKLGEDMKADMIIVANHHHKGFEWVGSLSEDLVNHANVPVLTYNS